MSYLSRETSPDNPLALTVLVSEAKCIDDVVSIARVEGRKRLGCSVKIIDLARESAGKFVVLVLPKYRSLDVGASSGKIPG